MKKTIVCRDGSGGTTEPIPVENLVFRLLYMESSFKMERFFFPLNGMHTIFLAGEWKKEKRLKKHS